MPYLGSDIVVVDMYNSRKSVHCKQREDSIDEIKASLDHLRCCLYRIVGAVIETPALTRISWLPELEVFPTTLL